MKKEIVKVPISAKRLDIALRFKGLNRIALAKKVGISESTIRRSAKAGAINEEYLPKICAALGVDEAFLAGEKELNHVAKAMDTLADYFAERII